MKFTCFLLVTLITLNIYSQGINEISGPAEYIYDSTKEHDLKAYVFSPKEAYLVSDHPAIVIFHGGGWNSGEPFWAFGLAEKYAKKGMVAVAAQYRLSDLETITPLDAMEDARNIIIWMREESENLKIDKNKIAAYGWSAGAHLAACTAIFHSSSDRNFNSKPNALLLVSPAVSIIKDDWFIKLLGDNYKPIDCSPAENINGELPPSIIVVGEDDTVTPVYESKLFHNNMLKNGNESYLFIYEGVGHLFTPSDQPDNGYPNPDKNIQKKAYDELDIFLKKHGYIKQ